MQYILRGANSETGHQDGSFLLTRDSTKNASAGCSQPRQCTAGAFKHPLFALCYQQRVESQYRIL